MGLLYQRTGEKDLNLLTGTRIQVLGTANWLGGDADISWVRRKSYEYYVKSLENRTHCAYLILDKDRLMGVGGVSFYRVMPIYHNPAGWEAYIMNTYTHLEYHRKGIALHMLDLLVKEARQIEVGLTPLEATEVGRPLYEKYGFVKMNDKMALPF